MRADSLQRLAMAVRDGWLAWAAKQPDADEHPSWLQTWDQMSQRDKDADFSIAEAVVRALWKTDPTDLPLDVACNLYPLAAENLRVTAAAALGNPWDADPPDALDGACVRSGDRVVARDMCGDDARFVATARQMWMPLISHLARMRNAVRELQGRVEDLKQAIALDRTGLAMGLNRAREIVEQYGWLGEDDNWGSYDEQDHTLAVLRREVRGMQEEIQREATQTLRASGALADAAFQGNPLPPFRKPEQEMIDQLGTQTERLRCIIKEKDAEIAKIKRALYDSRLAVSRLEWRPVGTLSGGVDYVCPVCELRRPNHGPSCWLGQETAKVREDLQSGFPEDLRPAAQRKGSHENG